MCMRRRKILVLTSHETAISGLSLTWKRKKSMFKGMRHSKG